MTFCNLAIIPARGGSKGLPRENIKLLNSNPMIAYTIETALNSRQFNAVIISTDEQYYNKNVTLVWMQYL